MYFDTHAHYYDDAFDPDRDEVLSALPARGVELVLCPGCDIPSSQASIDLAERYPHVYAAAGFHPENLEGATLDDLDRIKAMAAHPKVKAIGEIGLDAGPRFYRSLQEQEQVLDRMLRASAEQGRKVASLHSVRSVAKVLTALEAFCVMRNFSAHAVRGFHSRKSMASTTSTMATMAQPMPPNRPSAALCATKLPMPGSA